MARFYYSVGGRYSYLASTQMAKFDSGPYDWDYRRLDAERWADYYGVPYEEPRGAVHSDPELLARARMAADTLGAVRPYSESLFSAVFVDPLPEIGTGQCVERAETLGLPRENFARELGSPGTERRLAETAEEACSAGAFGVPTFVVDRRTYWGNDRLVLLRHFI